MMLASASCQRVCRMLGCSRMDTDPCIVMTLYAKSCQKRLEEAEGKSLPTVLCGMDCILSFFRSDQ